MLREKRLQAGLLWEGSGRSFAIVYLPLLLFFLVTLLAQSSSSFFLIVTFLITLTWCILAAPQRCGVCAARLVLCLLSTVFTHVLECCPVLLGEANPFPLELKYFCSGFN